MDRYCWPEFPNQAFLSLSLATLPLPSHRLNRASSFSLTLCETVLRGGSSHFKLRM